MLEGINILNTYNIKASAGAWFALIFLTIISACFIYLMISIFFESNVVGKIALSIIIVGIALITCLLWCAVTSHQETVYEVTIDDSVPMVEFYDNYEVVDRRGDIWEIKIKNDD